MSQSIEVHQDDFNFEFQRAGKAIQAYDLDIGTIRYFTAEDLFKISGDLARVALIAVRDWGVTE